MGQATIVFSFNGEHPSTERFRGICQWHINELAVNGWRQSRSKIVKTQEFRNMAVL